MNQCPEKNIFVVSDMFSGYIIFSTRRRLQAIPFSRKNYRVHSIATGYAERPSYSAGSYKIVQSVDVSTNLCSALYAIFFV